MEEKKVKFEFYNEKLLEYRKNKNLSQEEIAEKIGVSRQSIYAWESGKRVPDIENMSKLCQVLDITANDLTNGLKYSSTENENLKDVNKLNFGENTSVYLGYANYIPNNLDVSMCPFVRLDRYDFYFQPLKFKKDSEIYLEDSYNLPNVFDLSMCAKISLDNAYLIGVKEIKFGNNAEVSLKNCTCVPKNMDFSMCSKVDLKHSNLYSAKIIKFKNKKQMEEANLDTSNFAGRINFAEENTRLPNPNTPEI